MDWDNTTFEDALRMVAERRLFAQMRKEADAESAHKAQSARRTLGTLGVDEPRLNAALKNRSGFQARRAVPGALTQLGNVLKSVSVSAQQGDPNEALAQLDVLGLKNVVPGTDNFSPLTAATSGGLGLGAFGLQAKVRKEKGIWDALYGRGGAAGANDVLTREPGVNAKALERWRATNVPSETPVRDILGRLNSSAQPTGQPGRLRDIGRRLLNLGRQARTEAGNLQFRGPIGLPEITEKTTTRTKISPKAIAAMTAKMQKDPIWQKADQIAAARGRPGFSARLNRAAKKIKGTQKSRYKQVAPASLLTRDMIANAYSKLPKSPLGRLATFGIPAAAAATPLLWREWMGRGYRSGRQPINDLLALQGERR